MEIFISFLNSSFFVALGTIIVGAFAILLYIKQKKDHKRDAASLILQEIRYAEQVLRTSSDDFRFRLSDKLLPTNSWNDNIHLFLNDLEETEIDILSRFYSKVAYLDTLIAKISDHKNQPSKPVFISSMPAPTAPPTVQLSVDPMESTQQILREICRSVDPVYNTPTGEKLKAISKRKFLFVI